MLKASMITRWKQTLEQWKKKGLFSTGTTEYKWQCINEKQPTRGDFIAHSMARAASRWAHILVRITCSCRGNESCFLSPAGQGSTRSPQQQMRWGLPWASIRYATPHPWVRRLKWRSMSAFTFFPLLGAGIVGVDGPAAEDRCGHSNRVPSASGEQRLKTLQQTLGCHTLVDESWSKAGASPATNGGREVEQHGRWTSGKRPK